MRLPGLTNSTTVNWDESLYVLMGREILLGGLPYVTIFEHKPLGVPIFASLALAVSGGSVIGLRVLALIAVTVTSLILRGIVINSGLGRLPGLLAGLFFAAASTRLGGMTLNVELLVIPFNSAAFALALRYADATSGTLQRRVVAGIGSLFGVAIWLKYLPGLPACVIFLVLVGRWWWLKLLSTGGIPLLALIYSVTCGLPTIVSAAFYWLIGEWDVFWFSNFGFMPVYVNVGRPLPEIIFSLVDFVLQAGPLLFLALGAISLHRRAPIFITATAIWLVVETFVVAAPGRFYDHYFQGMLPPLSLLSGVGMPVLISRYFVTIQLKRYCKLPTLATSCAAMVLASLLLVAGRSGISVSNPSEAIAKIVRADSEPSATVWAINSDPIIYFLIGQKLPSRYVMPPHLVGAHSVLLGSDPLEEVERILSTRPRYLIFDPARGYLLLPRIRDYIANVVEDRYRLVARVPAGEFETEVYRLNE